MERRCRVCAAIEDEKEFRAFFDERKKFAEKLFFLSSIIVFEISSIQPALICNRCADDLTRAARIKKMSLETDRFFKDNRTNCEDVVILDDVINNREIDIKELAAPLKSIKKDENEEYTIEDMVDFDMADDVKIEILEEFEALQYCTPMPSHIKSKKSTLEPKVRTPRVKKINKCDFEGCGRIFRKPYYLKIHKQIHSDERNYGCDECGKLFKTHLYLKQHKVSHLKIRHTCDICGESFRNRMYIAKHMQRKHLKMYARICHMCGKSVSNPAMLKIHMLYSHGGEKNFQCTTCSKSFFTKNRLKQHVQANHGERPWVCEICSRDFSKRYKLGEHMKQIHKISLAPPKRYSCTLCGVDFDRNKLLQNHLQDKHQVVLGGNDD